MKIEVSVGEIVDKWTILKIKNEKVKDPTKLKNIKQEYLYLTDALERDVVLSRVSGLALDLIEVNRSLWDVEDKLRIKESLKEFDNDFIELARSVYYTNDRRAEIKREINRVCNSDFVEEKHYAEYKSHKEFS